MSLVSTAYQGSIRSKDAREVPTGTVLFDPSTCYLYIAISRDGVNEWTLLGTGGGTIHVPWREVLRAVLPDLRLEFEEILSSGAATLEEHCDMLADMTGRRSEDLRLCALSWVRDRVARTDTTAQIVFELETQDRDLAQWVAMSLIKEILPFARANARSLVEQRLRAIETWIFSKERVYGFEEILWSVLAPEAGAERKPSRERMIDESVCVAAYHLMRAIAFPEVAGSMDQCFQSAIGAIHLRYGYARVMGTDLTSELFGAHMVRKMAANAVMGYPRREGV